MPQIVLKKYFKLNWENLMIPNISGTPSLLFDNETKLLWVRHRPNTFSTYIYIERCEVLTGISFYIKNN